MASDARSNRPVTQWADPIGFTRENEGDFDRCAWDKMELILSRGPVGYIRFGFNELEIAQGVDPEKLHMECVDKVRAVLVSRISVDKAAEGAGVVNEVPHRPVPEEVGA